MPTDAAALSRVLDALEEDALALVDETATIVAWNAGAAALTGHPAATVIGTPLTRLGPQDAGEFAAPLLASARHAGEAACEHPVLCADGSRLSVRLALRRVDESAAYVLRLSAADVTQRSRRLQAEVDRVLAAAQSLPDAAPGLLQALCGPEGWDFGALWVADERSHVLRCRGVWYRGEGAIEALAGYTRALTIVPESGLTGGVWHTGRAQHLSSLAPVPYDVRGELAHAAGLDCALAIPVRAAGRVEGVIELFGRGIPAPDPALAALFETLGGQLGQFLQRRRAQEAVERVMAASPAVIYVLRVSQGGLCTTWITDNVLALTGSTREDALDPDWWRRHVHAADLPGVLAAHPWPYDRGRQTLEYRLRCADGGYRWVRDEKRPLGTAGGEELIGVLSDISERMSLEDELRRAQKMEAIAQFAAGVAHGFNDLLTVILGYSSLLIGSTDPEDPRRSQLAEIRGAGERAAALTRQLLAFSRKQILEPRIVDLNEALRNIARMLGRLLGGRIELVLALAPRVSRVRVDPVQFEQVVLNLAVNARDAMPDRGRLTIETRDVLLDQEDCRHRPGLVPGPHVELVIADTGSGMTPEVQARIFEPFFTTKEAGKGTGLGLATVFGIVRQSEGCIAVQSVPGAGTRFEIVLPAVDSGTATGAAAPETDPGGATVLLVEDEEDVRRATRLMLEQAGYRVIEAANGPDALAAAATARFDLLLTDVVMPEMSGRQLAETLKRDRPALGVVFMSGYTDAAMIRHGLVDVQGIFVRKPFAAQELTVKLREVIGAAPDA